jgi:thioredoxin 1
MVEDILGLEKLNETIENNETVLVDVWAAWCGPCKMIGPIVEQVASENPNIKVVKVDADANKDITAHLGVRSIPALFYYKNSELKDKSVGAVSKTVIVQKLQNLN